MRIDLPAILETIAGMHATSQEHLEGAGKGVLVNSRGTVEPIVDVYIKARSHEERDRRIAEPPDRIHLLGEIRCLMHPTNNFPWIQAAAQIQFGKCRGGNS